MKKLLVIAILMLALVFVIVACDKTPETTDTTVADTTVETPTEAPTEDAEETTETPTEETPSEEETTETPTEEIPTEAPTTAKPEDPTEPPTEEETTVDPAEPVWIADPDTLAGATTGSAAAYIAGAEVMEEGGYKFVRLTVNGGDSQFMVVKDLGTMPRYLAISYRANSDLDGEMFIGTTGGPNGQNDHVALDWNNDSVWSLMIVDLSTVANITDGNVGYFRLDPFRDTTDGSIDIEYIAIFNTAEYALAYDFELHPPYVEADSAASGKKGHSFDTFYVNGEMYFQPDGGHGDKLTEIGNTITFGIGETHESMVLRGWIGFDQPIASFGYFVDNYDFVYGEFATATEDGVLAAGGEFASRFEILVPLTDLTGGNHMVGFVVKLEDGKVVRLRENLTVVIKEGIVYPDTAMNVTVNAADNFADDAPVDATVSITNSNLSDLFTTVSQVAGDAGIVYNSADGAYFRAQGFSEAFVKMDGTYAYTMHSLISSKKQMASFFIRGAQSVKPEDTTGINNPLNNYYETDGQSSGHAGAGIQLWNHKRLFLGVKYYDENAVTKIGTAYWLIEIDCQDKDVQVIDTGSMVYITVDSVLAATVELEGAGKSYDGLAVTGGATFCEKATVTIFHDLKDDYGFTLDQNRRYVIENTLVVDTPLSDVGIATRTGTLDFTSVSIAPVSTVEIPEIPATSPAFTGKPSDMQVCADNVRTWVDGTYTDLCTQEAHIYLASVNGQINVDGLDAVSFRGWANPKVGGVEIAEFGYQIGMNEPVFSTDFWKEEPELNGALGSAAAKRFENILVPVADLEAGTYDLYLLVKDTNGVIYCMNPTWGSITLVKS